MSYYKYQNVKDIQEHKAIYIKGLVENENKNKKEKIAVEIPIFRNCMFDLERLTNNLTNFENHLFNVEEWHKELKSNLWEFINNTKASYLAPAYNYNSYIDYLIDYNLNNMNGEQHKNEKCNKQILTIQVQNIFISIKCLLDRLVIILSFYYNGLSLTSTFGRIGNNNKAKGLMNIVFNMKETDKFMNYIYEEYNSWIKYIVEPRDMIIHYNDMHIRSHYTADGREFFLHSQIKIFDNDQKKKFIASCPDEADYYKSLMKDVQKVYKFFDIIIEHLMCMKIRYKSDHFIIKSDFDIYKNNGYKFSKRSRE